MPPLACVITIQYKMYFFNKAFCMPHNTTLQNTQVTTPQIFACHHLHMSLHFDTTCNTLTTQISLQATLHKTTQHPLLQISACRAPSPRLPSPPSLTSLPSRRRLAHLRFFGERRKEILLPISRDYN